MLLEELAGDDEDDVDALLAAVDDAVITRTWGNPSGPRSRSVPLDVGAVAPPAADRAAARRRQYVTLGLLVVVGCANKVLAKLATEPMANYPNALNLLTTAVYVPLSYAYVFPVARLAPNRITPAHRRLPCAPFATMGALDALAATMQVFATTFLPGALVVLLLQFAIPVSMALSRRLLGARYAADQGAGAVITTVGVLVAIGPALARGPDDAAASPRGRALLWGGVLLASCVPMCLSSIYKEIRLKDHDLDAVFLNGRIAVFQFLFAIPSSFARRPSPRRVVTPRVLGSRSRSRRCRRRPSTPATSRRTSSTASGARPAATRRRARPAARPTAACPTTAGRARRRT